MRVYSHYYYCLGGSAVAGAMGTTTTMPKKAFLLSSFTQGCAEHPEVRDELMSSVAAAAEGSSTVRLCYIPTASYAVKRTSTATPGLQRQRARRDGKKRRDEVASLLSSAAEVDALTVDLWDDSVKQPTGGWQVSTAAEAILEAHLLVVDGGNTFWLWANLERYASVFKQSRAVYVGISAGAIVYGRRVSTALWKGWDDPQVVSPPRNWTAVRGLDLADGVSFFPHFDEEQWGDLVDRKRPEHGDEPLVPLHEHGAYIIDSLAGSRHYRLADACA